MTTTTCKVCNITSNGMISIFEHPNRVDFMYTFVSGISEIQENDAICIPCYDNLKIAYNFKQKCIQSNLLQKSFDTNNSNIKDEDREQDLYCKPSSSSNYHEKDKKNEPTENSQTSEQLISPSSTSLEKSIFSNRDKIVECESIEIEDDVDLFKLLHIGDGIITGNLNQENFTNNEMQEEHVEINKTIAVEFEKPSQSNRFTCNECGKTFNRCGNLKRHQKAMHFIAPKTTKIGRNQNKRGPSPKLLDNDIFAKLKATQCEYCFDDFETENQRSKHEEEHKLDDKPYKCFYENCKSQFKERFNFRKHIGIHSKVKKYACRYCDQRFHQLGNAKSHERYHTGEKPYVCDHCGKPFAESGNLKAHIRFHTGERPYTCPVLECSKRFTTHYSHKIHIRSHTNEKPYLCSDCGKRYVSSGKLLVHKRIHSGCRPYKCDTCAATFVDSSNLKRHSKIHSSGDGKKNKE